MPQIDLVLVNPNNKKQMYGALASSFSGIEPPLWTALIAAVLCRSGLRVQIIDAVAENMDAADTARAVAACHPLAVAVGVLGANPSASSTPNMPAVRRILEEIKGQTPQIVTILYGIHPSALPEQTLREEKVDFVCRGEVFSSLTALLTALKAGDNTSIEHIDGVWFRRGNDIIGSGWGALAGNLDDLPMPAWGLLPMGKYRAHNWHCFGHLEDRDSYAPIYTSLGCPFACSYCNISALYNGRAGIRFRSPEAVIAEIDFLVREYGIKNFKIVDELFVLHEERTARLCDLIIARGYNLNIWAYSRVDTVSATLLSRMKQAGINWLCYGIEAGSKEVRRDVVKGQFTQEAIREVVTLTQANGIFVMGNFMFGLPEDDLSTMQQTLDLALELRCEYANFYVTMAYPGSVLYEEMSAQGAGLSSDWAAYSQLGAETRPLGTKHLSPAQVLKFRDWAFEQYYNDPRYLAMIEQKFGIQSVRHIKEMLSCKVNRKLLEGVK